MTNISFSQENWGYPPYNRDSFQQIQSLFPTVRITRGEGPTYRFNEATRDLSGLTYAGVDGGTRTVEQMLDDTFTDSFLVVKDGAILTEIYLNQMGPESHHLMNSVSKSFIGALIGIVAAEGSIQVDGLVRDYVPELAESAFQDTTIRTALDMTAAVEFGEDYSDLNADFWMEASVVGWRPALVKPDAPATLFEYALSRQRTEQKEGEKYHYRTILTNVLAMVLERATDTPLPKLLQSRIWSKLGPEQDACIVVDRVGFPYVGAGMNACTRDLARFGQMIVGNGSIAGHQIVPSEWIDDIRYAERRSVDLFAASDYGGMFEGGHYRSQFWVADADRGIMHCIGIHGQSIHMNMSTGTVIVKFSSHPEPADMPLFDDTFLAMDAISELV